MTIKKLLERNALIIAITLTLIIAFLSLVSLKNIHLLKVKNSDKLGHFFAYFTLCMSWLYALKNKPSIGLTKITILFLLIAYGIIIEVLQEVLTSYRQADIFDVFANTAGVFVAAFLFKKVSRFL